MSLGKKLGCAFGATALVFGTVASAAPAPLAAPVVASADANDDSLVGFGLTWVLAIVGTGVAVVTVVVASRSH